MAEVVEVHHMLAAVFQFLHYYRAVQVALQLEAM
jgi:hypothetical protein